MAELNPDTERELRARILELETLVEARTQAIVGLGAQLAELRGDGSPVMAERLSRGRTSARRTARSSKVMRYSAWARRAYWLLRGARG